MNRIDSTASNKGVKFEDEVIKESKVELNGNLPSKDDGVFEDKEGTEKKKEAEEEEEEERRHSLPGLKRPASQTDSLGRRYSTLPTEYRVHINSDRRSSELSDKPRKRLQSRFNSFDYGNAESLRFLQMQQAQNPKNLQRVSLIRWLMSFLIGVYVAIIAISVTLCNKYLTRAKLTAVYVLMENCTHPVCLIPPTLVWMLINMVLVFIGAYMVTFHAPLAAGSGIPNVKCYLNGIKMPGLMGLRTLLAKAGGVVLSVSGGLACGKEGPMIHSGAICASGMSRAEFRCCSKVWKPEVCEPLRKDEERRDFVAAGAASGVSAAFGSPVGGVMFSLEEGASFLRQMLTWRMLFSSLTACLVLNALMSALIGHPGEMSHPGLVTFGLLQEFLDFRAFEVPIFMLMGVIGGFIGAAFVQLNYKITMFRIKNVKNKWLKVAEATLIAGVSAVVFMLLIYLMPCCAPIRGYNAAAANMTSHNHMHDHGLGNNQTEITHNHNITTMSHNLTPMSHHDEEHSLYGWHGEHGFVVQGFCPYGEHNRMADILFKTGEGGLHAMLHSPLDEWNAVPLIVLVIVYHLLATWTYGLSVSSGVFIPSLLIGAIWGRVVGIAVMSYIAAAGTNISKYALIGAAANLGGATRMTLSLAVIIIECTGDITFSVPIIITLIIAKWVGDFFNPGIYDLHIEIQGIPLLSWDPPEMSYSIQACDVMTCPVQCLNLSESMETLRDIAKDPEEHNGFPVVEDYNPESKDETMYGRLKGFLLKKEIEAMVQSWEEDKRSIRGKFDLSRYIDRSPYTIQEHISLPRIFRMFRGLGLRHLIVVNDRNRVVGIITRVNLARYRGESHRGHFKLEELAVEQS